MERSAAMCLQTVNPKWRRQRGKHGQLNTVRGVMCWIEATQESVGTKINDHHYLVSISKSFIWKTCDRCSSQSGPVTKYWVLLEWKDERLRLYFIFFLWIIMIIFSRHKARVIPINYFKMSIILVPIIVHSQDAQYSINTLLPNI